MFLNDTPEAGGTRIHENVVRRVLTAVSFDGGYAGVERLIYRNVFDLRGAVAGVRPTGASNHDPWLYGHVFKDGKVVSPFSYYQNTALISRGQSQFATQFFSLPATAISPVNKRHVFNNLFRYIAPIPNDVPVAVFPSLAQVELLDAHGLRAYRNEGNAWDRTGATTLPLFVCGTRVTDDRCKYQNFQTLVLMQAAPEYRALGWERSSIEGPAGLVSVGSDGVVRATDGLRLGPNAPALKAGVILQLPDPYAPMTGPPDIGAFQTGQDILGVGRNTGAAVY